MDLYVGTSGYSYREWSGLFYPRNLPARGMLPYYAEHFSTVEINNTFHRMPNASLLEGWREAVPPSFRFSLKAPQRITHVKRLNDVDDSLSYFLAVAGTLKERLGPLLFQLPPAMKKDLPTLGAFLHALPQGQQVAFEFRHSSWLDDEVFALLSRHQVALCLAETDETPDIPLVATADFGYLRLRRQDYEEAQLKSWVRRVREQPWGSAFIYFKHEDAARGPRFARGFLELAS